MFRRQSGIERTLLGGVCHLRFPPLSPPFPGRGEVTNTCGLLTHIILFNANLSRPADTFIGFRTMLRKKSNDESKKKIIYYTRYGQNKLDKKWLIKAIMRYCTHIECQQLLTENYFGSIMPLRPLKTFKAIYDLPAWMHNK